MSTTQIATPAYVALIQALLASAKSQGLPEPTRDRSTASTLPENEGYAFLRWGNQESAALIVPKGKTKVAPVHSHLDLSGFDGYIPLTKKNGRVVSHFAADADLIAPVLHLFVGSAKRPVAVRQAAQSIASPAPAAEPAKTEEPVPMAPVGDEDEDEYAEVSATL